jgi:hypothetical protein
MRKVFGRRGVAAGTKSGILLAIYVPHPLQQKLWHPFMRCRFWFTCRMIRDFFVLRDFLRRKKWIYRKLKMAFV